MNKKCNAAVDNLVGQKFNRLTVVEYDHSDNGVYWLCKCDCGNYVAVRGRDLKSGKTKSCGCYHKDLAANLGRNKRTHGKSETKLYSVWCSMKSRCGNPNNKHYYRYGGRGITVCSEWEKSFESFYEWSINNGYQEGLTIDRIDNDGNYEPHNCRWVTMYVQCRNKHKARKRDFYINQYGVFPPKDNKTIANKEDDE